MIDHLSMALSNLRPKVGTQIHMIPADKRPKKIMPIKRHSAHQRPIINPMTDTAIKVENLSNRYPSVQLRFHPVADEFVL